MGQTAFNIMAIAQSGRLQYEALILAASLKDTNPDFAGKLIFSEPQPGPKWSYDPRIAPPIRDMLIELGAEIRPFTCHQFGEPYPQGNKIEGLSALPENEPFLFLDTDTIITGDLSTLTFDFNKPSASMRREGTWPVEELYWPGYSAIWKSLYDKFDLDFESSLDLSQPDEYWERYLYFNAGWFFYKDPKAFQEKYLSYARAIMEDPTPEMVIQPIWPWLDQITLPLVIHSLGGGRPGPELDGLDGDITCHWRILPLAYARESDLVLDTLERVTAPNKIKKLLKEYDPAKRMIFQKRGRKARALFDQNDLPRREQKIRNTLKSNGFWMR